MLRALTHYWRIHLAVLAAAAVNTAVLTGALMVGDSVRGSLREMTLERLGAIDHALVAERFFRRELADDLASREEVADLFDAAVATVLLRGTAVHGDSDARASQVNVVGVGEDFGALFEGGPGLDLSRREGQIFPSVIVNEALRRQLGAEVGDPVLLHFRLGSEVPRDTLLGSKNPEDAVGTLRLSLAAVVPDEGVGRFSLSAHQSFPLNAFVAIDRLQATVGQEGGANALLLSTGDGSGTAERVRSSLEEALTLDDLGLTTGWTRVEGAAGPALSVESRAFVLRPPVLEAVERVAAELGAPAQRVRTYLANSIEIGERTLPYSTVTALGGETGGALGELLAPDGATVAPPSGDRLLLNSWAADELGAAVGDRVTLRYYLVGRHEELLTGSHEFEMAGVVAMEGLGADRELTPAYPGIEGADTMAAWDPPFPVDLGRVEERDEEYWERYRATPKAFVSEETARQLWSTRYGSVTSVRLATPGGSEPDAFAGRFRERLVDELELAAVGMRLMPVKADGLRAASGATDFGGLFIGFSLFLIVSAALLVGLLFSLGVERRAAEIGLRLAVGFPAVKVGRQMLGEGLVLAAAGGLVGLAGAIGYAAAMMAGLRTLWVEAVGSPRLHLHVEPASLVIGWAISVAVAGAAVWFTVRRLRRATATSLLAGSMALSAGERRRRGRAARAFAWGGGATALGLVATALATGDVTSPALAMGTGSAMLIGGLGAFALWCRRPGGRVVPPDRGAALRMAARNSSWSPGRSILSVALVASACFVIVTVAANQRDPSEHSETVAGGAGGYELMATSDVPLLHDLERASARADLGFPDSADQTLDGVDVTALRTLPGDDASCLNLYRPERPTILGVPAEMIARGGFRFASLIRDTDDPWELLTEDLGPGVVPAFGDANSMQWILKLGLGEEIAFEDQRGETVRVRLVGTLSESVFQSEMLISEEQFTRHFPDQAGYSTFLVDVPEERVSEVSAALEGNLTEFGFDAVRSAEKIAGFLVVQNTYLSTFQLLGGLGLLLGTLGLGIVLLRNVIERRAELATLRSFGYRRSTLSAMVLAENAFLLLTGLLLGSGSALLATAPRALTGAVELPLGSLLATLALVLVVGLTASAAAVASALRTELLPVLKSEA